MGFNSNFSFLGIGIPELVFIVMLALVVLGPERLPTVAKDLIRAFFKLRNLSKDLTGQLESELGVAEIKELKGIKTGKLIEDWANDELNLNFDEDEKDRAAAKKKTAKSKQLPAEAKSKEGATDELQDKGPAEDKLEKANPVGKQIAEAKTEGAEVVPKDTPVIQKVENQNVIGSANSIGTFPGGAAPDMNGTAANELGSANAISGSGAEAEGAAASISMYSGKVNPQQYVANGMGRCSLVDGTFPAGASPRPRYGWQEALERRKQLRIRILGPSVKSKLKKVHPSLQRSRLRKQSAASRYRSRQNLPGLGPLGSVYWEPGRSALDRDASRPR